MTPVHSEDIKLGPLEEKRSLCRSRCRTRRCAILPARQHFHWSGRCRYRYRQLSDLHRFRQGTCAAIDGYPSRTRPSTRSIPRGASMGFIVTRGFRNVFNNAVGTAEMMAGWGQPDDLVWAYAHSFKENGGRTKTQASRLYVSRTICGTTRRRGGRFLNGEDFYDVATPLIVNRMKERKGYDKSDLVVFGHPIAGTRAPRGNQLQLAGLRKFQAWLLSKDLPPCRARHCPT